MWMCIAGCCFFPTCGVASCLAMLKMEVGRCDFFRRALRVQTESTCILEHGKHDTHSRPTTRPYA